MVFLIFAQHMFPRVDILTMVSHCTWTNLNDYKLLFCSAKERTVLQYVLNKTIH